MRKIINSVAKRLGNCDHKIDNYFPDEISFGKDSISFPCHIFSLSSFPFASRLEHGVTEERSGKRREMRRDGERCEREKETEILL